MPVKEPITPKEDHITINGIELPKFNRTKRNHYTPKQIMAAGGLEHFAKLIGYTQGPVIPNFEFTQDELQALDQTIQIENQLKKLGY